MAWKHQHLAASGFKIGIPKLFASPISLILHTAKKGPKLNRSNTKLAVSGEVFDIAKGLP